MEVLVINLETTVTRVIFNLVRSVLNEVHWVGLQPCWLALVQLGLYDTLSWSHRFVFLTSLFYSLSRIQKNHLTMQGLWITGTSSKITESSDSLHVQHFVCATWSTVYLCHRIPGLWKDQDMKLIKLKFKDLQKIVMDIYSI